METEAVIPPKHWLFHVYESARISFSNIIVIPYEDSMFSSEERGSVFLRNADNELREYRGSHSRSRLYQNFNSCIVIFCGDAIFDPEDGGSKFLRNVGNDVPDYTVSYHRRQQCCEVTTVKFLNLVCCLRCVQ
jgi:hypothetical protein